MFLDGLENQSGQKSDGITRCEVFSRLLIVFFIKPAKKLLEHSAHAMIGKRWQYQPVGVFLVLISEVDSWICHTLDDREQAIIISQLTGFVVIIEVFQHVAHILAIAIQILREVIVEQIIIIRSLRLQTVQRPTTGVEIAEIGDILQSILIDFFETHFLLLLQFLLYGIFCWLQQGIQATQYYHREYHITILSAKKHIS